MQSTLVQHPDPQADPHDTVLMPQIGALSPAAPDPSELHINPVDHVSTAPQMDLLLDPVPGAPPFNDNRMDLGAAEPRRSGGFARFLVATAIGVAVTIGWQAYGEEAWQALAGLAPHLVAGSSVQAQSVNTDEQPSPPPVQAAAEAAPEKPAPVGDTATAAPTAAPVQAASSADLAPLMQEMSREIASLRQTVDQLKAGQQQLSRDLAREQDARRKVAATASAPKPVAAAPRKPPPPPYYSSASNPPPPVVQQQAIMPPPVPQPSTVPGYAYVPRPPRPLP